MALRSFPWLLGLAVLVLTPAGAAAQQGFHPRWEIIPGFDISRDGGWRVRARRVRAERARMLQQRRFGALNAPLRAGAAAVTQVAGTLTVPVVLFHYQDTNAGDVRDTSQYSALLWGAAPPLGRPYTLRTYYEQLSNGVFSMQGRVMGWAALDSVELWYTGDPNTTTPPCNGNPTGNYCNGIFSPTAVSRMQGGLREALAKVDTGATGVDFGEFDNDGPDGVPNSGDDDGIVDMMAFAHATRDGACGNNNHIWAHRYVLLNASGGLQDYITNDPAAGGGTIRVRDYFIQSGLGGSGSCDSTQIMPIGTAAHEFGHALGLPDLYDTQGSGEGIGRWGLMGSGNYSAPNSPARMEAWSLNELGWVTVVPLTTSGTYSFGAAPTADTAFYVEPLGTNVRGEYFLLENRQRVLADTGVIQDACTVSLLPTGCNGGLLVWHVDGNKLASGKATNAINAGTPQGLHLMQADGLDQLVSGANRGDAGDFYPGKSANTALTYTSNPAATLNADGSYVGFDIDQITQQPDSVMSFRLTFATLPPVTLAAVLARLFDPSSTALTSEEVHQLDLYGNHNGQFDVGDFKAWVDATGPGAAPQAAAGATP